MSQATATARATARPGTRPASRPAPSRPELRVVSAPQARPRLQLAIGAMALLAVGLVVLLMLNISLSRGSYELYQGQLQQRDLDEQRQALREQLMAQQAPQQLAQRARALGMVPAGNPAFVRLPDGSVVGVPQAAKAEPKPTPSGTVKPSAKPSSKPSAKPTAKPGATKPGATKPGATKKPSGKATSKPKPSGKPTP